MGPLPDGPHYQDDEPLAGVNVEGEPVARHLKYGTIQTADRGTRRSSGRCATRTSWSVSVADTRASIPNTGRDLASVGSRAGFYAEGPGGAGGVRGPRDAFISHSGYVPGRRALGKRRIVARGEFFPVSPLSLATIDWCAGVRLRCTPRDLVAPGGRGVCAWRVAGMRPCALALRTAKKVVKTKRRIRPVMGCDAPPVCPTLTLEWV